MKVIYVEKCFAMSLPDIFSQINVHFFGNCNGYELLVTWILFVQFGLQSYLCLQIRLPPNGLPSL